MVQAVTSAVGGDYGTLAGLRFSHLEAQGNLPLDVQRETANLDQLLRCAGHSSGVRSIIVTSIGEIEALLGDGYVFVGFPKGTDAPPHIAHVQTRLDEGFLSNQGYTSDYMLAQSLMEQGELVVFIASY